jgi:nucleoside-diphosphate-sugar epimerase
MPGRIGNGSATWNYAFVEDVVAGHLLALDLARPGQRFILGGENVSMDGFLDTAAELSGVEAPARRIPGSVARSLAFVMEMGSRLTGNQPALTREVIGIYEKSWAYSSAAAEAELGYRPTPFADALSGTIDWVRATMVGGSR